MAKKENTIPTIIDTPEALTAKIAAMKEAQKIFATFTQEQVDKIFKAAATAADAAGDGLCEPRVLLAHLPARGGRTHRLSAHSSASREMPWRLRMRRNCPRASSWI